MSTTLPQKFLESLQGVAGFDRQKFVAVHENPRRVVSIRLNKDKCPLPIADIFPEATPVPWSTSGYYLPVRPSFTLDPLLHAGAYYVQEPSSMFIEQCLKQHMPDIGGLKLLDLCGAPGGKSTLMLSVSSSDSLVVSNEVIKSRVPVLIENLTKWGAANVVVTNNDPSDFQRIESFFDVMVIDAPCSGSGLFRRDPEAIKEWSADAVRMCSVRQQRILNDAYASLKKGGLLVYSTCSYSQEENEDICDWLKDNFDVSPLPLTLQPGWGIIESESKVHKAPGYRFYPDKLDGEGFFTACFRKNDGIESAVNYKRKRLETPGSNHNSIFPRWINDPGLFAYVQQGEEIHALPSAHHGALEVIHSNLYVKKAGVRIGKVIKSDLVPDHELAVSGICNKNIQGVLLNRVDALQYLRKEEVKLDSSLRGWTLARYMEMNIGWIKLLGNRSNNYYPKEWRVLKSG